MKKIIFYSILCLTGFLSIAMADGIVRTSQSFNIGRFGNQYLTTNNTNSVFMAQDFGIYNYTLGGVRDGRARRLRSQYNTLGASTNFSNRIENDLYTCKYSERLYIKSNQYIRLDYSFNAGPKTAVTSLRDSQVGDFVYSANLKSFPCNSYPTANLEPKLYALYSINTGIDINKTDFLNATDLENKNNFKQLKLFYPVGTGLTFQIFNFDSDPVQIGIPENAGSFYSFSGFSFGITPDSINIRGNSYTEYLMYTGNSFQTIRQNFLYMNANTGTVIFHFFNDYADVAIVDCQVYDPNDYQYCNVISTGQTSLNIFNQYFSNSNAIGFINLDSFDNYGRSFDNGTYSFTLGSAAGSSPYDPISITAPNNEPTDIYIPTQQLSGYIPAAYNCSSRLTTYNDGISNFSTGNTIFSGLTTAYNNTTVNTNFITYFSGQAFPRLSKNSSNVADIENIDNNFSFDRLELLNDNDSVYGKFYFNYKNAELSANTKSIFLLDPIENKRIYLNGIDNIDFSCIDFTYISDLGIDINNDGIVDYFLFKDGTSLNPNIYVSTKENGGKYILNYLAVIPIEIQDYGTVYLYMYYGIVDIGSTDYLNALSEQSTNISNDTPAISGVFSCDRNGNGSTSIAEYGFCGFTIAGNVMYILGEAGNNIKDLINGLGHIFEYTEETRGNIDLSDTKSSFIDNMLANQTGKLAGTNTEISKIIRYLGDFLLFIIITSVFIYVIKY